MWDVGYVFRAPRTGAGPRIAPGGSCEVWQWERGPASRGGRQGSL